ncbi:Leucine-rich repeat-containing protein [Cynara cardunculus var. scolymus]|uniref:Leucine-rich repeat-containing protein n=1 Tax=Cynara cardunculus var. scolymus TaxID=59895 RepID=A0A103XFX6_CYNCS|nr:Leucine-rich repeat-containing protein [Cynara cardunculus var. scolymus]
MASLPPPPSIPIPLHTLFLFVFITVVEFSGVTSQQFLTSERNTLLNLKQRWGNPPSLTNWNASSSPCKWPEVFCNANGSVIMLNIPSKGLTGPIPASICDLRNLKNLLLYDNFLTGEFPRVLYNCLKLIELDISQNVFFGRLPDDIDLLSGLKSLVLGANNFTGDIPPAIGNLSALMSLLLYQNLFNGTIPSEIGNLSNLESLGLAYNSFATPEIPPEFGKLSKLKILWMTQTNLIGKIPESFGNLSSLESLDLSSNNLEGEIPSGLFLLKNLSDLFLYKNNLSGQIPSVIESLNLTRIDLAMNMLNGSIPEDFGKLQQLEVLHLFSNQLSGDIPTSISQIPTLKIFRIFRNNLSGELPSELGIHSNLEAFEVSENKLTGKLPENLCAGGTLFVVVAFSNNLTGEIPGSLESCDKLHTIQLYDNSFTGEFPSRIWTLFNLTSLRISRNQLSGELPTRVAWNLSRLEISDNKFSGQIPAGISSWTKLNVFKASNNLLSGEIPTEFTNLPENYLKKKQKRDLTTWKLTSFHKLEFTEANILSCLTENNLIGTGGSGKVYQIEIGRIGEYVAVKKIWNNKKLDHNLEKEFLSEVQILGSIRHSNIVKLLCCISSNDSKLLVYEYMANQSLDKWLHSKKMKTNRGLVHHMILDWPRRLQIAIGAAQGLCYMHHDCFPAIIHRDVKSSNILLDSEFKARIADFGLAKILTKQKPGQANNTLSAIAGSFGYIPPDVYSFGVVLLELVTGKEPHEGDGDMNLAEWAWWHYGEGNSMIEALDPEVKQANMEEISLVFKLGLICTSTLPSSRPSMKEVLEILRRCKPASEERKVDDEFDVAPLLRRESYLSNYRRSGSKVLNESINIFDGRL